MGLWGWGIGKIVCMSAGGELVCVHGEGSLCVCVCECTGRELVCVRAHIGEELVCL